MIVEVSVVPGSKRFSIAMEGGRLRVHLKSQPERNKANIELIKELTKATKSPVRLISGATSRKKILEIGMTEVEWESFLLIQPGK